MLGTFYHDLLGLSKSNVYQEASNRKSQIFTSKKCRGGILLNCVSIFNSVSYL